MCSVESPCGESDGASPVSVAGARLRLARRHSKSPRIGLERAMPRPPYDPDPPQELHGKTAVPMADRSGLVGLGRKVQLPSILRGRRLHRLAWARFRVFHDRILPPRRPHRVWFGTRRSAVSVPIYTCDLCARSEQEVSCGLVRISLRRPSNTRGASRR